MSSAPLRGVRFDMRVESALRRITLDGELDAACAGDLATAVIGVQLNGPGAITIRLDDVVFMDMAGLGSIVGARLAQRDRNDKLVLVGASPRLRRLFDLAGLADLLDD